MQGPVGLRGPMGPPAPTLERLEFAYADTGQLVLAMVMSDGSVTFTLMPK